MNKFFQVTIYTEKYLETTDHKGKNKLQKEYKHYLIKADVNDDYNIDDIVKEFTANKFWIDMNILEDSEISEKNPSDIADNYRVKKITQVKLLPIEEEITYPNE